jgi:hypothetical protein
MRQIAKRDVVRKLLRYLNSKETWCKRRNIKTIDEGGESTELPSVYRLKIYSNNLTGKLHEDRTNKLSKAKPSEQHILQNTHFDDNDFILPNIAAGNRLMKLQHQQYMVLRTTGNFPRCTPARDLHKAFRFAYVCGYITKLCK